MSITSKDLERLKALSVDALGGCEGSSAELAEESESAVLALISHIEALQDRVEALEGDNRRLSKALNTPEVEDFARGTVAEAQHQRERWGAEHDQGKEPLDWFWLVGYLAQKAATAAMLGDTDKAKHHTISTSAALANWHAALAGHSNDMVPGAPIPIEADAKARTLLEGE